MAEKQTLVSLPQRSRTPLGELGRRAVLALAILLFNTLIVYSDRGGYSDNTNGDGISLLDALYYATVTITTTGYGDITPVSDQARLFNALLVTPLRIAFLVLLVGTTMEVLASEGRRRMIDDLWRKRMRNHVVVLGYGTMGKSAVATLLRHEVPKDKIVVVDASRAGIEDANAAGLAAFEGDATSRELLTRAGIFRAKEVIITVNRDDSAILCTLTVRQMNARAHVVVAVRAQDNVPLLRQSGADAVITSSAAVGRIVGLSTVSPNLGETIEDLLSAGEGLEVAQRQVARDEVGLSPADIRHERILGVIRGGILRRFHEPGLDQLATGDELIVVRPSG